MTDDAPRDALAPLLRGLVWRWLLRHRVRSLLGFLAVSLGVAAYIASAAVGESITSATSAVFDRLSGGADLSVEGRDQGVPAELVRVVEQVDGVAAAAPLLTGWVRVEGATGGRILLLGVDPMREPRLRRHGAAPDAAPDAAPAAAAVAVTDPMAFLVGAGALLTAPLAEELGVSDRAALRLRGAQGLVELRVAGVLDAEGPQAAARGRVAVVTLAAAQSLLGRGELADRIDLMLAPGADPVDVEERVRAAVRAAGVDTPYVGPPRIGDDSADDVLGTLNVALRLGAVIALLIGVFLIHHTLAVGVAERRREIGILRALGATRSQVARVFCAEALVLGTAGSLVGVGLAYLMARGALQATASTLAEAYFQGGAPEVHIPLWLAASGVVVGALVALVAAAVPASRAAREAPSDAIRRGPLERGLEKEARRRRIILSLVLNVTAASLVLAPGPVGATRCYISLFAALFGLLALAPVLLVESGKLLAPILSRLGGLPGRLAADDLRRSPQRAALPAAALAFGLALVIETLGTVVSLSVETERWMESQVAGDLFVSSGEVVLGVGGHTPYEESLADEVRVVPGVAHVVGVRMRTVPWRDTRLFLLALDMEPYRPMAKVDLRGDAPRDELLRRLAAEDVCIASGNLAVLRGVDVGDRVELDGVRGRVELEVVGHYDDYSWPTGAILVDRRVLREQLDDHVVDQMSVKLVEGADPRAVAERIDDAVGDGRDLVVTSAADYRAATGEFLDEIFRMSYAQVGVALAVAFLGVLNALWISVVLRRREMGLLRSVGATRGQVTAAVVLQGVAIGVIGSAVGVVMGLIIEWIALRRFMPAETGWIYPVIIPWGTIAITVALATAVSALAALPPARLAARTPVREAIGYE